MSDIEGQNIVLKWEDKYYVITWEDFIKGTSKVINVNPCADFDRDSVGVEFNIRVIMGEEKIEDLRAKLEEEKKNREKNVAREKLNIRKLK